MWKCLYCRNHVENVDEHVKHLQDFHGSRSDLQIPCGKTNCRKIFTNFSTRRSHLSRCHASTNDCIDGKVTSIRENEVRVKKKLENYDDKIKIIAEKNYNKEIVSTEQENTIEIETTETIEINEQRNFSANSKENTKNMKSNQEHEIDLLTFLQSKGVPEISMMQVKKYVKKIVRGYVSQHSDFLRKSLKQNGIVLEKYINISSSIEENADAFSAFPTKWKQNTYMKKQSSVIDVKRILLEPTIVKAGQSKIDENRQLQLRTDKLMYISMIDILKDLFKTENFTQVLQKNEVSETGIFKSYLDGSLAKNNELFKNKPDSLQILLYYDDVNYTDTASARPTKMGMFYFTIANIHPAYRSSLKYIYLLSAVDSDILQNYNISEILKPIVTDLKTLENGINSLNGDILYGTVSGFLGDNLASHKIGGFKEGFTADHSCRTCLVHRDLLRVMVREDKSLLRTQEQYDAQVEQLKAAKTKKEFSLLSKQFGLNGGSLLNELRFYGTIFGLPPDIFHDLIEGSILRTLHLLLRKFLTGDKKKMSVEEFNQMLTEFGYGYTEIKPSVILPQHLDSDGSLHQTGAQIWSLSLITPLILGPIIDYDNEFWVNYILLLEIMSLACAHQISLGMIEFLQHEIEEYLTTFRSIYDLHLIPKQHYLLHYPSHILKYGPLYNYNTMRMEGMHQFFKDFMRKIRNMKNPPLSLANQYIAHHRYINADFKTNEQGAITEMSIEDMPFRNILPHGCQKINTISWLTVNGIKYIPDKCFVMVNYINNLPLFALVHEIILIGDKPRFIGKSVRTVELNLHFNAYQVSIQNEYNMYSLDQLYIHSVYHSHEVDGQLFIIVKRAVGDLF